MCGLSFIFNADTYATGVDKFLKDAFLAGQVRGTDGSGMFQVMPSGKVEKVKKAVNASDFLEYRATEELLASSNRSSATVCHVRSATQGTIVDANAHPFEVTRPDGTKLIGVHNGTIADYHRKVGSEDHDVDSAWLFEKLATDGADAFAGFEGAYALIWYDTRTPDQIWTARNDKRPLYYAYTDNRKTMIGASELGMLGWLADRNGLKLWKDKDGFSFFYFNPGRIYSINLKDVTDVKNYEALEFDAQLKLYVKPVVATPLTRTGNIVQNGPNGSWSAGAHNDGRYADGWPHQQGQRSGYVSQSTEAYKLAQQTRILEATKHAMKLNDTKPVTNDDNTELEEGIKAAIAAVTKDDSSQLQYLSAPITRSVLPKEMDTARSMGMYGLVVKVDPVMYDDDADIMYVTFKTHENGADVDYDGMVRTCGQQLRLAIEFGMDPVEMSVCGAQVSKYGSVPLCILSHIAVGAPRHAFNAASEDEVRVVH